MSKEPADRQSSARPRDPAAPNLSWEGSAADIFAAGLRRHQAGNLAEAERHYRKVLAADPGHAESLHLLGVIAHQVGKDDVAVGIIKSAIRLKSHIPAFHNNLALALQSQGKLAEAEASYRRALTLNPNYAEAHFNLGIALNALNRADAVDSYRRALAARPHYPEASNNLGNALKDLGRLDEAVDCYRQALATNPDYSDAHNNLGNALKAQGRLDEAIDSYRRALAIRPDYAEAHNNLGDALKSRGRLDEAAKCYNRALELKPDFADAHRNLGAALQAQGRFDEAVQSYERALVLTPDDAAEQAFVGAALLELGRIEEARRRYEAAIRLAPRRPYFHRLLGAVTKYRADDPRLEELRALAADAGSFSVEDQIELHFALGKACEDIGEHDASFRHLVLGNALKRRTIRYDERAALEELERIRRSFTAEAMAEAQGAGEPSAAPVFIVGMPRSGSTLIEQILASHPQVHGSGELNDFTDQLAEVVAGANFNAVPSGDALRALGSGYVAALRARSPDAARITDKMPGNFRHVGLIHLALPNAKIIHSRRDPIDTCLSCFSQLFFNDNLAFTYDLAELGRQYRAYRRMMDHWRAVVPESVMLDVDYEALVNDLEGQARRIVAHCGLDWDDACLNFHETRRAVKTVSAAQVRRPVYSSSIGRWRPDAGALRPLTDALDGDPGA